MNNKLKIRKGDTVKVISGKDKGKTGKVLRVLPEPAKVVVENIAVHTKFQKNRQAGQPGQKVSLSSPIAISKVMLIDSAGKPTRTGYQFLEDGTKQRIAKSNGKIV